MHPLDWEKKNWLKWDLKQKWREWESSSIVAHWLWNMPCEEGNVFIYGQTNYCWLVILLVRMRSWGVILNILWVCPEFHVQRVRRDMWYVDNYLTCVLGQKRYLSLGTDRHSLSIVSCLIVCSLYNITKIWLTTTFGVKKRV